MAIASRTSSYHYHHILHCIIPPQTPILTLFQATPHSTSHHQFSPYRTSCFISHQHLSQHIILSTLQYHIGLKSHHICHIMHHATSSRTAPHFHIPDVPHNATFQITPYIGHIIVIYASHHILHKTLHRISHAPHLTVIAHRQFHIHYYGSRNIPHHPSVHHVLHPTTCRISHSTTSTATYCAVSQPTLYLIPPFHVPIHITQLSITPFRETWNYM